MTDDLAKINKAFPIIEGEIDDKKRKYKHLKENMDELVEGIAKVQHYMWIKQHNPKQQIHYNELSESDKSIAQKDARRVISALYSQLLKGSENDDESCVLILQK